MSEESTDDLVEALEKAGTELIQTQGYTLLSALEKTGAITDVALRLPPDLPYAQYEALMATLCDRRDKIQWLIGDLILYGEKVYGETYSQAEAVTGLAYQTLANYASVCSRIPRSRRRPRVKFSTHALVASLEPNDQKKWLKLADDNHWTRQQLHDELNPQEKYQSVAAANGAEVLPPEVKDDHACQCVTCGRWHWSHLDVITS